MQGLRFVSLEIFYFFGAFPEFYLFLEHSFEKSNKAFEMQNILSNFPFLLKYYQNYEKTHLFITEKKLVRYN